MTRINLSSVAERLAAHIPVVPNPSVLETYGHGTQIFELLYSNPAWFFPDRGSRLGFILVFLLKIQGLGTKKALIRNIINFQYRWYCINCIGPAFLLKITYKLCIIHILLIIWYFWHFNQCNSIYLWCTVHCTAKSVIVKEPSRPVVNTDAHIALKGIDQWEKRWTDSGSIR